MSTYQRTSVSSHLFTTTPHKTEGIYALKVVFIWKNYNRQIFISLQQMGGNMQKNNVSSHLPQSRQRDNGFTTPSCARFKASRQPPLHRDERWRNSYSNLGIFFMYTHICVIYSSCKYGKYIYIHICSRCKYYLYIHKSCIYMYISCYRYW